MGRKLNGGFHSSSANGDLDLDGFIYNLHTFLVALAIEN